MKLSTKCIISGVRLTDIKVRVVFFVSCQFGVAAFVSKPPTDFIPSNFLDKLISCFYPQWLNALLQPKHKASFILAISYNSISFFLWRMSTIPPNIIKTYLMPPVTMPTCLVFLFFPLLILLWRELGLWEPEIRDLWIGKGWIKLCVTWKLRMRSLYLNELHTQDATKSNPLRHFWMTKNKGIGRRFHASIDMPSRGFPASPKSISICQFTAQSQPPTFFLWSTYIADLFTYFLFPSPLLPSSQHW